MTGREKQNHSNLLPAVAESCRRTSKIALRDHKLSMGHARAIISTLKTPDVQLLIFKRTVKEDLSVRQVEELARTHGEGQKRR